MSLSIKKAKLTKRDVAVSLSGLILWKKFISFEKIVND